MARDIDGPVSGVKRYVRTLIRNLLAIDSNNEYIIYYNKAVHLGENPSAREKALKAPSKMLWDHIVVPLESVKDHIDVLFCTKNIVPPLVSCSSVVTVYDLGHIIGGIYPAIDSMYMNIGLRWSIRKSSAIIAISDNTKTDLVTMLGAEEKKIHRIYLGIDASYRLINDSNLLGSVRAKYSLPSKFILTVSSLHRRKNLQNLVRAFSLIKEGDGTDHKLVIVGIPKWQHSAIIDEINSSPFRSEILLLSSIPEHDLPAIYNLASVFAFPSLYEGFGLPLIEAMACGCPVVCSNTSSLPEVAGDAAVLIDPVNIEQLANGISSVLVNQTLKEDLKAKGLRRASQFSWEKTAKETLEVFNAFQV